MTSSGIVVTLGSATFFAGSAALGSISFLSGWAEIGGADAMSTTAAEPTKAIQSLFNMSGPRRESRHAFAGLLRPDAIEVVLGAQENPPVRDRRRGADALAHHVLRQQVVLCVGGDHVDVALFAA